MRNVSLLKLGLLAVLASGCTRPAPTAFNPPPPPPAAAPAAPPVLASSPAVAAAPDVAMAPSSAPVAVPAARRATTLRVDRLVIARGVESREPLGADTVFRSGEKRLFAFVEVDNPEHAPGDLHVQFVGPNGETQPPIELAVGESPRWRTWAFTRHAHAPGTWKALVRDDRGHVLASTEFDVRG